MFFNGIEFTSVDCDCSSTVWWYSNDVKKASAKEILGNVEVWLELIEASGFCSIIPPRKGRRLPPAWGNFLQQKCLFWATFVGRSFFGRKTSNFADKNGKSTSWRTLVGVTLHKVTLLASVILIDLEDADQLDTRDPAFPVFIKVKWFWHEGARKWPSNVNAGS